MSDARWPWVLLAGCAACSSSWLVSCSNHSTIGQGAEEFGLGPAGSSGETSSFDAAGASGAAPTANPGSGGSAGLGGSASSGGQSDLNSGGSGGLGGPGGSVGSGGGSSAGAAGDGSGGQGGSDPGDFMPCAGKGCGEACDACAPGLTCVIGSGFCQADGSCIPSEPTCDALCPDDCPVIAICELCDDGSCAVPEVACNPDGSCGDVTFACPGENDEYDPCVDKIDGDPCTVCDPTDSTCVETAVAKQCRSGECAPGEGNACAEEGESCAGGETCCFGLTCCSGIPVPRGAESCNVFCPISDRSLKRDFSSVDGDAVLERVAELPISTWSYKTEPSRRHIGPMAQDFIDAFGVGSSDKTILQVDADGVALAAIQALHRRLEQLEDDNRALRRELEQLEALECTIP